ncbi:DUF2785 domain-containing protein [Lysobacter sp. F6437]|uniref:DUF2785 domain-containing protein n=1 Tax=Lysobacter sp. F6437 TaxID=3459296 RepID=UPI00403D7054
MSMHTTAALAGLLLLGVTTTATAALGCPPDGWTRASLQQLKDAGFETLPATRANTLAPALVACLADPDPAMRDGIAYEALSSWMRGGQVTTDTVRALRESLYARLDAPDPDGFGHPFAALVLAEVARTDRIAAWMTPDARARMVERAATYLEGVDDYRGFQPDQGWRHGVAHGADWLMQLSLNPALDEAQRQRILDAVSRQVVPDSHAYIFGEPDRLAAPVLVLARAGMQDEAGWRAWLTTLAARVGEPEWKDAGWLARRHDLRAFLLTLHASATLSEDPKLKTLLPGTVAALRAMP